MVESSVLLKFSFLPNYSKINTYLLMETAVKSQQILYCTEIILKELPQNYSKVHLETQIFLKKRSDNDGSYILWQRFTYTSLGHRNPTFNRSAHILFKKVYISASKDMDQHVCS